ncbi:MAG: hypothetical protein ACLP53_29605 [Isosphaeraceae bacterium]
MQWQDHRTLAEGLRDQGLVDCLVAWNCLKNNDEFVLFDRRMNLAHVVAAKAQQAIEKVTKGWLLWLSSSFDPTKGHTPFTRELESQVERREFKRLLFSLNRLNRKVISDIKWLEGLAPHTPFVPADQAGAAQPLTIIAENTEYPFWLPARDQLVASAEGLFMRVHGSRAIKAARTFLEAMAQSDPPTFTKPIRQFLEEHRISTEFRS